jgi:hypothetical protein
MGAPLDDYHRGLFLFLRDQRRRSAADADIGACAPRSPPGAQAAALHARVGRIRQAGQAAHARAEARERARLAAASSALAAGLARSAGRSGSSGSSQQRIAGPAGLQRD